MQVRGKRPMSGSNFKIFFRFLEGKIPTGPKGPNGPGIPIPGPKSSSKNGILTRNPMG